MNTITPAELLSLVIQYAQFRGQEKIDRHTIEDVIDWVALCGKIIAEHRVQ